jgi:NAD(P)H-dependent flavin oxidoreductase YrpB (nitropropane dioxygenase family)
VLPTHQPGLETKTIPQNLEPFHQPSEFLRQELQKPVFIDGAWILPLIQGGKGVGATNGVTAGAWARQNAGGTIAATGASATVGKNNRDISYTYQSRTRPERHEEMIDWSVKGCTLQAQIACQAARGKGRVRINFLKMAGGSMRIMRAVLANTRLKGGGNMIHAVTMGAGLPTEQDAQICADEGVYLDPIISSSMALKVLLKRTYRKWRGELDKRIGAVIYEDPWLAGGHNGITSRENPDEPQNPYDRVRELRAIMNANGMENVAIVMAGGVWYLRDWESWLNNPEIGPIAFQIGTRDLLTQECPIVDEWKKLLLTMKEGDIALNKFSPTGFYSSAYKNRKISLLYERSERQIAYANQPDREKTERITSKDNSARAFFISPQDKQKADGWKTQGYSIALRTPDETLVFVSEKDNQEIKRITVDCVGCLATCKLTTWCEAADNNFSTGAMPDPRVHCIREGLLGAIEGDRLDDQLIFAGHNAYKAGRDPFYRDETGSVFIPTVKQLIDRLLSGN